MLTAHITNVRKKNKHLFNALQGEDKKLRVYKTESTHFLLCVKKISIPNLNY